MYKKGVLKMSDATFKITDEKYSQIDYKECIVIGKNNEEKIAFSAHNVTYDEMMYYHKTMGVLIETSIQKRKDELEENMKELKTQLKEAKSNHDNALVSKLSFEIKQIQDELEKLPKRNKSFNFFG
jgi:hypothetical protein